MPVDNPKDAVCKYGALRHRTVKVFVEIFDFLRVNVYRNDSTEGVFECFPYEPFKNVESALCRRHRTESTVFWNTTTWILAMIYFNEKLHFVPNICSAGYRCAYGGQDT